MPENEYDLKSNDLQNVNMQTWQDSANTGGSNSQDNDQQESIQGTEDIPKLSEEEQNDLDEKRNSPEFQQGLNDILPTDNGNNQNPDNQNQQLSKLIKDWQNEHQNDSNQDKQENKTGLPNDLKSGLESLSGISLDDVKVHYNSSLPAKYSAHAFAQGNTIHLAPDQMQHLAHEAWHVIQQKQGRVQGQKGLGINDNPNLEREADVMGNKALRQGSNDNSNNQNQLKTKSSPSGNAPIQRRTDHAQQLATHNAWQVRALAPGGSSALADKISFQPNTGTRATDLGTLATWRAENTFLRDEIAAHQNILNFVSANAYTNYSGDGLDGINARILANDALMNGLLATYDNSYVATQKAALFAVESSRPNLLNFANDGSQDIINYTDRTTFINGLAAWVNRYFIIRRSKMIEEMKHGARNGGARGASVWDVAQLGGRNTHMTIYNNDMNAFGDYVLPIGATMGADIDNHQLDLIPNGAGNQGTHMSIETTGGNARMFGNPANTGRKYGAVASVPAAVSDAAWSNALNSKITAVWLGVQNFYQNRVDDRA